MRRVIKGLHASHEYRRLPTGNRTPVPIRAVLLSLTDAQGYALGLVVVPSEEHKFVVFAVLALYGVKAYDDDIWKMLDLKKQSLNLRDEDKPAARFIYEQVRQILICAYLCCCRLDFLMAVDNHAVWEMLFYYRPCWNVCHGCQMHRYDPGVIFTLMIANLPRNAACTVILEDSNI